jgi:hypothetical protein
MSIYEIWFIGQTLRYKLERPASLAPFIQMRGTCSIRAVTSSGLLGSSGIPLALYATTYAACSYHCALSTTNHVYCPLQERGVTLWTPFQPMLCKRTKTLAEAVKIIQGHMATSNPLLKSKNPNAQFVIEEKLDGERMQLHKRGNAYFYSSR